MIPVNKSPYSVFLVTGFQEDEDKLTAENLGPVFGFDAETHSFVSPGLTLEMSQRLPNYYLQLGNHCFPKWNGFKSIWKSKLKSSYEAFLRGDPESDAMTSIKVATAGPGAHRD